MLRYLVRTMPIALRALTVRTPSRVSRLSRTVLPSHLDLNWHMNQAVYAQSLELGRTDLLVRSGAWRHWRAYGINPVVAQQTLTYRRELKPFARYEVETRAVGMDGRLLCIEGLVCVGDQVHARSEAKLIFVGPSGVLSAQDAQGLCVDFLTDPALVVDWRRTPDFQTAQSTYDSV